MAADTRTNGVGVTAATACCERCGGTTRPLRDYEGVPLCPLCLVLESTKRERIEAAADDAGALSLRLVLWILERPGRVLLNAGGVYRAMENERVIAEAPSIGDLALAM